MSSVAVGALYSMQKMAVQQEGKLVTVGMIPRVYEVFQLLGFTSVMNFADSIELVKSMILEKVNVFPAAVSCVICSKKLKAPRSGMFRCPSCSTILAVSSSARVSLR